MILVLFRSRLTSAAGEDYAATNARMERLARSAPGFHDLKSYTADDGERLTIVWWKDAETLRQWREDPAHRAAQDQGRRLWYEFYAMDVAEVVRESNFARPSAHGAGA